MKKYLLMSVVGLFCVWTISAQAQTAFWSYDENNQETLIPIQCDGQFDEARGGVFIPTPEEMFEQGELFLMDKGQNRNNAGYCFLAAALQGNVDAQYRVAQLYSKGIVLPQNDLAAYKWAFIAALNGKKEAEQLALMMEQFLSTEDIELATKSIENMLPAMSETKNKSLSEQEKILSDKKAELEKINQEIDNMLGIKFVPPVIKKPTGTQDTGEDSKNGIFTEKDRMRN